MLLKARTIRSGVDLGPCRTAIQRPNPALGTSMLYSVYIEDGVAKVATTAMVDRIPTQWDFEYSLVTAVDVAIGFDGAWKQGDSRRYNFYTIGSPWIAIVRPDGRLTVQQGQLDVPNQLVAGGVTKVSMIRGWKGTSLTHQDQGLVVVYIRDGAVRYRNRAEQANGDVIWESEKTVSTLPTPAVNVAAFRTNDYRLGIVAEVAGKLHWTLTERMWAGMGIGEEHVGASLVDYAITVSDIERHQAYAPNEHVAASLVDFCIGPLLYGLPPLPMLVGNIPVIEDGSENWGKRVRITFDHNTYDVVGKQAAFTVIDEDSVSFLITMVDHGETIREVVLTMEDFNDATGDLTVTYDNSKGLITGEAGQAVNNFEETFTPANLVPSAVEPPELEAIWNE